MRVDAPDLAETARAAVPSLYRPHPRYRPAVTCVAGARLLPTLTVNRLNQDASGTLSPPVSRTALRWARGDRKTSDCRDFGRRCQRSALGKPRTSRAGASMTPSLISDLTRSPYAAVLPYVKEMLRQELDKPH